MNLFPVIEVLKTFISVKQFVHVCHNVSKFGHPTLQQKCDQYWPDDGSDKHWEIDLKILREETFPGYTIRDFELTKVRDKYLVTPANIGYVQPFVAVAKLFLCF